MTPPLPTAVHPKTTKVEPMWSEHHEGVCDWDELRPAFPLPSPGERRKPGRSVKAIDGNDVGVGGAAPRTGEPPPRAAEAAS